MAKISTSFPSTGIPKTLLKWNSLESSSFDHPSSHGGTGDKSFYFFTSFSRSGLGVSFRNTIDPSLSIMARGFDVAPTSLSVDSNRPEQDPLSLSNPESQNGVEEEENSPLEENGGWESIPCGLRASTRGRGEAQSQVATPSHVDCNLQRVGKAHSQVTTLSNGASLPSSGFCELRRGGGKSQPIQMGRHFQHNVTFHQAYCIDLFLMHFV